MNLAEYTFPESKGAIRILSEDHDTCFEVAKQVGKSLLESNEFIPGYSFETMAAITSQAWFAEDENECLAISTMIMTLCKSKDILPLISVHKNKSLAARCIISLGLFKPAMEIRHSRHGAPSPAFYRKVGISEFRNNDMKNLSEHFLYWEGFLNEMFVL